MVDVNETMHATPTSTVNHEKKQRLNVTISALLETRGAAKADRK